MYLADVTEPAERDIQNAVRYIAVELQNRTAAIRLFDDIYNAISLLEKNPFLHTLVKDEFLANQGIRLFPIRNYIMFYAVRNKTVVIIRFLYGKRDWVTLLQSEITQD